LLFIDDMMVYIYTTIYMCVCPKSYSW
jgi:hypothetical protein